MTPRPIYKPEHIRSPAYHLRYTWSGWPSSSRFAQLPSDDFFGELDRKWQSEGLRRLEMKWTPSLIQMTFSVKPPISPVFFASRVKGRLQHALRNAGLQSKFSRKVGFRTIGENRTSIVNAYIKRQVDREKFVDDRFAGFMRQFTVTDPTIELDEPTETNSGRYWYNLHLVLVVNQRTRFVDNQSLRTIDRGCVRIASKRGYAIASRSVMPDHLHLALRGNIEHSPQEMALAFMNNLAYVMRQNAIWQLGYYVGTFGVYDMGAVRTVGTDRLSSS